MLQVTTFYYSISMNIFMDSTSTLWLDNDISNFPTSWMLQPHKKLIGLASLLTVAIHSTWHNQIPDAMVRPAITAGCVLITPAGVTPAQPPLRFLI